MVSAKSPTKTPCTKQEVSKCRDPIQAAQVTTSSTGDMELIALVQADCYACGVISEEVSAAGSVAELSIPPMISSSLVRSQAIVKASSTGVVAVAG